MKFFYYFNIGRVNLEKKWFQLRRFIEVCIDMVRSLADNKNVELILTIPSYCPQWVLGDEFYLTQVLTKYSLCTA